MRQDALCVIHYQKLVDREKDKLNLYFNTQLIYKVITHNLVHNY